MPEILRSLLVVLFLSTALFFFVKKYAVNLGLQLETLKLRINAWYFITLAAFLCHNVWLFFAIAAVVLLRTAKKDANPFALVLFLLYAVPLFSVEIPGAGIVNYIFELDYFRLISLLVLFPLYLKSRKQKDNPGFGFFWADRFLGAYIAYSLITIFPLSPLTNTLRVAFGEFLDIFLPYYVASRYIRTKAQFDDALQSLLIASGVVAIIGVMEFLKGWLLYSAVPYALGVQWFYGGYLLRGEGLRASVTSGQPIVMGYTMAVALGIFWYLGESLRAPKLKWACYAVLIAGLLTPLSRGPWMGGLFIFLVIIFLGPTPIQKVLKICAYLAIPLLLILLTPYGSKLVAYLPFVGTVDADTVTYRQRLFENSLIVIRRNLWFGSPDYLSTDEMESLRAGANGGIIDLVNSYLAILLSGGLVACGLFVGYFLSCAGICYRGVRVAKRYLSYRPLGKSLLATLLGMMFIIYTVSSILMIPILYWILGGLCVAYGNLLTRVSRTNAP